jgi:AraC-like DNA-binding protein
VLVATATNARADVRPPGAACGATRSNALGQITSLFVRKVLSIADARVDRDDLLRSVGLDPDGPVDPARMVPAADYYAFLERLADLDPEGTTLPLRVGAAMQWDDYGAFGLAWKSAPDLRGSYARAERYARVLTNVTTYEVEPVDGGAFMHLRRDGERRLGLRLSNEASLASIVSISRQASSREFHPREVHCKHPAPASTEHHEAYFGCPVVFASDRDALLVATAALDAPNRLGDASISRFFEAHLDAVVSRLEGPTLLDRQVLPLISRALSEGVPRISDVARQLAMSPRTLQRRLAAEGRSYQGLVDEARHQLCTQLLTETDSSLGEVSFMAGFSDQSAFTRAFRRWEGMPPGAYRLRGRSAAV